MLPIHDEKIPLATDDNGVMHIAGTRVTLDCVAEMFYEGASPEEIAQEYDALQLADVYAVITFLLRNQQQVEEYLSQQASLCDDKSRDAWAKRFPPSLRAKLVKAKHDQQQRRRMAGPDPIHSLPQ